MRRGFIHPNVDICWLAAIVFYAYCHLMLAFATKKAIVIICHAHNLTLFFCTCTFACWLIKSSVNKCGAKFSKSWLPFHFCKTQAYLLLFLEFETKERHNPKRSATKRTMRFSFNSSTRCVSLWSNYYLVFFLSL